MKPALYVLWLELQQFPVGANGRTRHRSPGQLIRLLEPTLRHASVTHGRHRVRGHGWSLFLLAREEVVVSVIMVDSAPRNRKPADRSTERRATRAQVKGSRYSR